MEHLNSVIVFKNYVNFDLSGRIKLVLRQGVIKLTKIGKVTHYYDKLGVAIVKPTKAIKVGDKIKFGEEGFEQTVESMQFDHKAVEKASPGKEVGIKVDKKAREGTLVYSA